MMNELFSFMDLRMREFSFDVNAMICLLFPVPNLSFHDSHHYYSTDIE